MDHVLTFPRADESGGDAGTDTLDRGNRTFICAVLFLDIADYSKKPVSQQLRMKERFNACLSEALENIAANDRIILDTGDGAAVNFLGDLEDALFVAISLAQLFKQPSAEGAALPVRIGINLGPVQLMRDINGQLNIIGDGINVAERVMSFADSGQVLVSRWYFEAVTRISEEYTHLFSYQGARTDKHVREHEIYAVESAGPDALDVATRRHHARPVSRPSLKLVETRDPSTPEPESSRPNIKISHLTAVLSCLILVCAVIYYAFDRILDAPGAKVAPAVQMSEPAKPAAAASHAASDSPQKDPVAVTSSTPQTEGSAARSVPRKSTTQHKPATMTSSPTEAPMSAPDPVNTQTAKTEAAAAPGSQSGTAREQPTAEAYATASEVGTAAPPNTVAGAKPRTALVMFALSPWGEVVVDGKSAGVSPPLAELELAPGTHQVEIRNGAFAPHVVTLQLESNQTVKVRHKFSQR